MTAAPATANRSMQALGAQCRAVSSHRYGDAWQSGDDLPDAHAGRGLDSVWTYVSVRAIAEDLRRTPRTLTDADDNPVERGPLCDLLEQPNPVQGFGDFVETLVVELLTATSNSVAIIKDFGSDGPSAARPTGRALPRALYIASADRLLPVFSGGRIQRRLVAWRYTSPAGASMPFAPEEIIPIRIPGPAEARHPLEGVGPREASRASAKITRACDLFTSRYFENDATPGLILVTDEALSPMQIREMTRAWEGRYGGVERAHRAAILHKGLRPHSGATMNDIALKDVRDSSGESERAAFGVPPIRAGIVRDANRANSVSQLSMYRLGAVMGMGERIAEPLNRDLVAAHEWPDAPAQTHDARHKPAYSRAAWNAQRRRAHRARMAERRDLAAALDRLEADMGRGAGYDDRLAAAAPGRDLHFAFNHDADPALIREKLSEAQNVKGFFEMGTPLNVIYDWLDLPAPRDEHGEVAWLPFSITPAEDLLAGPGRSEAVTAEAQEDAEEETAQEAEEATEAETEEETEEEAGRAGTEARRHGGTEDSARALADERAVCRGMAERHRATWLPLAAAMRVRQQRRLRAQLAGVLARLEAEVDPAEVERGGRDEETQRRRDEVRAETRAEISEARLEGIVFDLDEAEDEVAATMRPIQREAARLGAAQGLTESGLALEDATNLIDILIEDPNIQTFIDKSATAFRLIEQDRHRAVREAIREVFADPEQTFVDLQRRLRDFYDGDIARATRAANTESARILNGSRHEGMKAGGVTGKGWLDTGGNVRPTHLEATRRYLDDPIPIDQPFIVGGFALMFPSDPDGPPQESINCNCVQTAALLGESGDRAAARGAMLERYRDWRFTTLADIGVDVGALMKETA